VFIFVLGLLLDSSNPAKEEEREFLTQTLFIIKVFTFRKVFSGQYRQTQLEGGDTKEVYCLLLFSFYSLAKNTLIYRYHPACGMA
jgi:hypothetical protein